MFAILQAAMSWASVAPSHDDSQEPIQMVDDSASSLESMFEALESPLLIYAFKLTQDRQLAEDLVQEAFCRISPHWEEIERPRPWLYRTIYNLAMSHHRSKKKWTLAPASNPGIENESGPESWLESMESDPASPFAAATLFQPDQAMEREEAIQLTRVSLQVLDPRSREALRLKYEENFSYKQIGQVLGITPSNVGFILCQSLKALAVELQRLGVR